MYRDLNLINQIVFEREAHDVFREEGIEMCLEYIHTSEVKNALNYQVQGFPSNATLSIVVYYVFDMNSNRQRDSCRVLL
jgi:hypothetical protein